MSDLVEFLRARLDEDEENLPHALGCQMTKPVPPGFPFSTFTCDCPMPARVLRDVEAKRELVNMYEPPRADFARLPDSARSIVPEQGFIRDQQGWHVIRVLASVYLDHPDYREEWRP